MSDSVFSAVNGHFLDKVMALAEEGRVEASEDIIAVNGMKLIAKGAKLSVDMQERLLMHRLKKPLEKSMCVEDPVDVRMIIEEAERLADEIQAFGPLLGSIRKGISPLHILNNTELNNALKMLLTLIEHGGHDSLRHYVAVSLVGFGLAHRMGASEHTRQTVTIGGMFHDAGELYIDPEILKQGTNLHPAEWKHVFAHPVIGQKLIAEVSQFDPAVATAMLEHHERYNGHGYPRKLNTLQISFAGQLLGVAETITGMLMRKGGSLERADIALKVIPHEYSPMIVSAVSGCAREARALRPREALDCAGSELREKLADLSARLASADEHLNNLGRLFERTPTLAKLVEEIDARLAVVERAFVSTGLHARSDDPSHRLLAYDDADIAFEIAGVINEIEWRVKEIHRDIVLSSDALGPGEGQHFDGLIGILAGSDALMNFQTAGHA